MSHSLYLDTGSLSGCISSAHFPLDRLYLCWLLPFSRAELLLPCEEGKERLEIFPHLPEILWGVQRRNTIFLIQSPCQSPHQLLCLEGTQTEGGSDYHPASTQAEGRSGYHPSLQFLCDANQARTQPEYELIQETQELAERYKKSKPNRQEGMQGFGHR